MTVRRIPGQTPAPGKPMFMRIWCDFCSTPPLPLERAIGYSNVVGYDLHACPECHRTGGLEHRPVPAAAIAARLRKHGVLPKT